ncbi:MAG: glycosyltransferase family 2 protein [Actinomycetota bacterium]|nr:glycosyltransferase family 2 protein [Actinomycetota bacterium]
MTDEPPPVGAVVGAVVVNYNAGAYLGACLDSLQSAGVKRIVVVDNHSTDGSEAVAASQPTVTWLPSGANLGYGKAANVGAAVLDSEYFLVCNPDLIVSPGSPAALLRRLLGDPALAVVGPRMVNPDGSLYPSARTFPAMVDAIGHGMFGLLVPNNPFTRRYRLLDWDHRDATRVDWVSGACFLARREAWDDIGGFDPRYFMYLEDVDLCWRAQQAGWAVGYEPAAEVMHVQGVSAGQHPYRMLLAHHRSMWRFAGQSTTGAGRLMLPVLAAGLVGRLALACLTHRFGSPVRGAAVGQVP